MKKRNNNILILSLICIVLITSIILFFALKNINSKPAVTQTLMYDFNVTTHPGFMLDDDALHFGGITAGGYSTRPMTITANKTYLVKIHYEGPGSLIVDNNNFIIQENTNKSLEFTLTPINTTLGYYSGTIFFDFYKVK